MKSNNSYIYIAGINLSDLDLAVKFYWKLIMDQDSVKNGSSLSSYFIKRDKLDKSEKKEKKSKKSKKSKKEKSEKTPTSPTSIPTPSSSSSSVSSNPTSPSSISSPSSSDKKEKKSKKEKSEKVPTSKPKTAYFGLLPSSPSSPYGRERAYSDAVPIASSSSLKGI